MNKHQTGFTLIELVIVISIIGILAATALPRYINLQTEARTAKAKAIYGSIRSASALAHAGSLAGGLAANASVNMEGATVTMVNHYPTADANGIINAAQLDATNDGLTIGGALTIDINGGTAPNCRISYTAAPANGAPAITLATTGC